MKPMIKSLLVVAVSAAGLTFSLAEGEGEKGKKPQRGPGGPQPGGFLKQMDKDGDGKVTKAEAGERWERLGKLDKNGDGAVSQDELPDRGKMFEQADKDGDGKISQAEAGERWKFIGKMDKDGDGAVSKEELAAGRPPRPGGGGGDMFARADKDGNGQLTEAEVPAEAWARLSKADANGDGAVTKEELGAARKKAGGRPGAGNKDAGAGKKPKRPPVEGEKKADTSS